MGSVTKGSGIAVSALVAATASVLLLVPGHTRAGYWRGTGTSRGVMVVSAAAASPSGTAGPSRRLEMSPRPRGHTRLQGIPRARRGRALSENDHFSRDVREVPALCDGFRRGRQMGEGVRVHESPAADVVRRHEWCAVQRRELHVEHEQHGDERCEHHVVEPELIGLWRRRIERWW